MSHKKFILSPEQFSMVNKAKTISKKSWIDIANRFNQQFQSKLTNQELQSLYHEYKDDLSSDGNLEYEVLKSNAIARKNATKVRKENKEILDHLISKEDIIDSIKNAIKEVSGHKFNFKAPKRHKGKTNMTVEVLFSDVHYGKKTDEVNISIIRQRVKRYAETVLEEIGRKSQQYNIDRIIISAIGDIIENAHFHGKESVRACEFGTSRQVFEAIRSIYEDLLIPLASTGLPIEFMGVTGNHDRIDEDKTYNNPGEDNLTYIIYKTVEMMVEKDGLKNISFNLPTGLIAYTEIYGHILMIEHGDMVKNTNKATIKNHMNKRQAQINSIVSFFRIGHFHEECNFNRGEMIINGSVPGQDGYADCLGFSSAASQVVVFYTETQKDRTPYYSSFPVYLGDIKL